MISTFDQLIASGTVIAAGPRTTIFVEFDDPEWVYFVRSGSVERFVVDEERGLQTRTYLVEAEQLLGLEEVMYQTPRFTSARVVASAELVKLSAASVRACMAECAELRDRVLQSLCEANARTVEWAREATFATVEQRLARVLADELVRDDDRAARVENVPTLERLAEIIGTSPRSIRRVFSQWFSTSLIVRHERDLLVSSPEGLLALASG